MSTKSAFVGVSVPVLIRNGKALLNRRRFLAGRTEPRLTFRRGCPPLEALFERGDRACEIVAACSEQPCLHRIPSLRTIEHSRRLLFSGDRIIQDLHDAIKIRDQSSCLCHLVRGGCLKMTLMVHCTCASGLIWHMRTFFGPRAECFARGLPVPRNPLLDGGLEWRRLPVMRR